MNANHVEITFDDIQDCGFVPESEWELYPLNPGSRRRDDKVSMAAYQRYYRQHNREYALRDSSASGADRKSTGKKTDPWPFAGFDCEGGTIHKCKLRRKKQRCDDLKHETSRLVNMVCGDLLLREASPGKGLAYQEIFNALCQDTPKEQIVVGFSNSYDISMILATVEQPMQIINLVASGSGMVGNDETGWWFCKYRRGLEFFVSPQCRAENGKFRADPDRGHAVTINDTFRLFGKAFVKVIYDWKAGTESQRALVSQGKDNREYIEYLDAKEIAVTDRYCQTECRLLEQVMETLRQDLMDSGLVMPDRWQSPGYIARKILQQHHVMTRPEYEYKVSARHRSIFKSSYYGGWFETIVHGPAPGTHGPFGARKRTSHLCKPIVQLDINSAYPWALTQAPCPRHFTIERRKPGPGEYAIQQVIAEYDGWADEWGVVRKHGQEDPDEDLPAYMGLPWRGDDGHICRPLKTMGWYWSNEVAEARHQKVDILESYTVVKNCDCDPWGFIRDLFHRRQQLKKLGKDKPLKLGLNAIYGALAQSVGSRRYSMYMFSSFITAFVRAHIMRTIHQISCEKSLTCGWNVLMVATDAIFVVGDPGLPESNELGGWSKEVYPNGLNIVQGGIYFTDDQMVSKSRGFPANVLQAHIDDFKQSWQSYFPQGEDAVPNVTPVTLSHRITGTGERVRCKRFVGAVESVYRATIVRDDNKWYIGNLKSKLGTWEYMERTCAYQWKPKRELHWQHHGFLEPGEPIWTVPLEVPNFRSAPYDHQLADAINQTVAADDMDELFQQILNDTPDWLAECEDEG